MHLNNFDSLKSPLEVSVQRGLSTSGLVNKLTTFMAAAEFFYKDSPTIDLLSKYRSAKSAQKRAALKRKWSSIRSVILVHFPTTILPLIPLQ